MWTFTLFYKFAIGKSEMANFSGMNVGESGMHVGIFAIVWSQKVNFIAYTYKNGKHENISL